MSAPMIAAAVGMMVCCSSSVAAMMMGGEEKEDPVVPKTPAGPACKPDQAFTEQTGTVACESIDDFKPEAATWWGSYIGGTISNTEATAAGHAHSFHELSSTATNKKYIAMQKTAAHCKMVEIDVTKVGDNCNYSIGDAAGYTGMNGNATSGDPCTATTDAEVVAQWNAKTAVPIARTAATDAGYGLKSIKYSMYC
jgi:hypothetical protein